MNAAARPGSARAPRALHALRAIEEEGVRRRASEIGGVARAVGQACGENHLPIVIPCHRVVAANGLGGFAHSRGGYLLDAKKWLLGHERAI